jgi:CRISPR/Cas system CMR-associated protein Cmr5 small subunit
VNSVQPNILFESIREETPKWSWSSSIKQIDGEAFKIVENFSHLPYEIIKIEKIENDLNFIEYFASKACVSFKNSDEFVEEIGFYGSPSVDPNRMCTEKLGFDFRKLKEDSFGKAFHLYEDGFYLHAKNKCFREPTNRNICKIILAKQIVGQTWDSNKENYESLKLPPKNPEKQGFILERYDSVTGYTETKRKITVTYENYTILPLFIITYDETKPKTDINAQWFYGESNAFENELNNEIEFNFLSGLVTFPINIESTSYFFNLKDLTMSSSKTHYKIIRRVFKENIRQSCFITPLDFDFFYVDEKINNSEVVLSRSTKKEIIRSLMNIFKLKSDNSNASIKISDLDVKNKEYKEAKDFFQKHFKRDPQRILKIQKIDNPFILIKYFVQKILLALKSNCIDEERLFHGTSKNEPKNIYSDTVGFDMRYSNQGMWGKANYFAVNSSYSDMYSYKIPFTNSKQMFIAKVLIGDSVKVMPSNSSLIEPPSYEKNGKQIQHDSVNGETIGSVVYMIYENSRAYPEYLVTYE